MFISIIQLHPGYDTTIDIPISQGGVIQLLSLSWVATAGSLGLAVLLLLCINCAQRVIGTALAEVVS